MGVTVGDKLPAINLISKLGDDIKSVDLAAHTAGKKVVLFGLPGAFTGTCNTAHMPSFVRNADAIRAKGVDEIICVSVNDAFAMEAWGESTGAHGAGITMLADWDSELAKSLDMAFSAPPVGLKDRMKRLAMIVENGEITALDIEDNPGECNVTAGEAVLEKL